MIWTLTALLAAVAGPPADQRAARCATITALPVSWSCVETPRGVAIAATRDRATQLAALAKQGEGRFLLRFATPVPSYAVVEMKDGQVDPSLDAQLKQRRVAWRLPWLSEAAMAEGYRTSITRAVTAKAQAMGLDADRSAALVQAALAQQAAMIAPEALRAKEAGALPHELGHGWFINAFWPDATARVGDHYGGPAPDWMDETAAVMMEDDRLADSRRRQFRAIHASTDPEAKAKLVDLSLFLSGGHPAVPKVDLAGATSGVRVLTGEEASRIAAVAGTFYLQARLFADYVTARSGDPAAFRSAARAFAAGRDTARWLAEDGARLHLPTTAAALQRDWEAWLATSG